jgi:hypothetical protein
MVFLSPIKNEVNEHGQGDKYTVRTIIDPEKIIVVKKI